MQVPDSLESPHKGQSGIRRLINAFFYSLSGLALAFRHESAFRQEIALATLLIPLACVLPVGAVERVLLIASVLLVLIIELLNSSVEAAIDRIGFDAHRLSKRAKDLGSAAVLMALRPLLVTWLLLAVPVMLQLGGKLMRLLWRWIQSWLRIGGQRCGKTRIKRTHRNRAAASRNGGPTHSSWIGNLLPPR